MIAPKSRVALATLILTLAAAGCARPSLLDADLVITGARVWTGNPVQPEAEAVAIIGDRIVEVGDSDRIARWRGARTTVIDGAGRRLVPGFNDAQMRLVDGGTQLESVDLSDADTPAEFARRITERAKSRPGEWILGGRWDEQRWTPSGLPTRSLIDEGSNSSPVFVVRFDGTMALANSAALGRAGITEHTPDPTGGTITRDASGFPTGVMTGAAIALVERAVPKTSTEQRLKVVKRVLELAESLGVTSVQDTGASYEDIAAYAELASRGELTVRVYALPAEAGWYDQAKLGVRRAFGSPWLRVGAVHAVVSTDREPGDQQTRLMAADHAGLQLSLETTGDAALPRALDLLEEIARANGGRDRRFRLSAPAAVSTAPGRFASLNAIALLRAHQIDGARPLMQQGVRVALGSGWPTASLNPMMTIHEAAGQLTVAEALAACTSGAAAAEFQDSEKGTIARGKLADMVILSDDILSMPAARIKDVRVLTTIVGGRVVHQRNP